MNKLPVVVIVGRPNVGKSSLFNRIAGSRKAIVEEASGTTRDRVLSLCKWLGVDFELIDTGGFILSSGDKIVKLVTSQIKQALKQADVFIFVCDAQAGLTPLDEQAASIIRKAGKRTILALNKADNENQRKLQDFYRLGLSNMHLISALHGTGIGDLLDDVIKDFKQNTAIEQNEGLIKVAIVGKPNVGKSSLLNFILKEDRVIVDDVPGTTRDSIDTYFTKNNDEFLLIDTAGIIHKRKLKEAVGYYSLARSQDAIRRSDVSLLLIDGYEGPTMDDFKILDYINEQDKGCILVVNKWDLVKNVEMAKYKSALFKRADFLSNMPVLFVSVLTGRNVDFILDTVKKVYEGYSRKIQTKLLNDELQLLKESAPAPAINFRKPKLNYILQTGTKPPAFTIFANNPSLLRDDYTRFIENRLRVRFDLLGAPIKISYRKK